MGIEKLQGAGIDLSKLSDAQKQVLSELSDAELDTLMSVKDRLQAAEGEVGGLAMAAKNDGIFYH